MLVLKFELSVVRLTTGANGTNRADIVAAKRAVIVTWGHRPGQSNPQVMLNGDELLGVEHEQ